MVNEQKSFTVTILLAVFFGWSGAHRFYTGHIATGVLQLLTLGGCGLWTLIDFIMIIIGKFNTADGQALQK